MATTRTTRSSPPNLVAHLFPLRRCTLTSLYLYLLFVRPCNRHNGQCLSYDCIMSLMIQAPTYVSPSGTLTARPLTVRLKDHASSWYMLFYLFWQTLLMVSDRLTHATKSSLWFTRQLLPTRMPNRRPKLRAVVLQAVVVDGAGAVVEEEGEEEEGEGAEEEEDRVDQEGDLGEADSCR